MTEEITYLPEVECIVDVENGMHNTQVIGVPDDQNNKEYLRVGKGTLVTVGDKSCLPVGIVYLDYKGKRALGPSQSTKIPASNEVRLSRRCPAGPSTCKMHHRSLTESVGGQP